MPAPLWSCRILLTLTQSKVMLCKEQTMDLAVAWVCFGCMFYASCVGWLCRNPVRDCVSPGVIQYCMLGVRERDLSLNCGLGNRYITGNILSRSDSGRWLGPCRRGGCWLCHRFSSFLSFGRRYGLASRLGIRFGRGLCARERRAVLNFKSADLKGSSRPHIPSDNGLSGVGVGGELDCQCLCHRRLSRPRTPRTPPVIQSSGFFGAAFFCILKHNLPSKKFTNTISSRR